MKNQTLRTVMSDLFGGCSSCILKREGHRLTFRFHYFTDEKMLVLNLQFHKWISSTNPFFIDIYAIKAHNMRNSHKAKPIFYDKNNSAYIVFGQIFFRESKKNTLKKENVKIIQK